LFRSIRIGVHSGPVTAGVLRGERSRFQLFGNTMNTAARLEHTGQMNRIQVSETTAELLRAAGKEHWLRLREDMVDAKGIGKIRTYWACVSSTGSSRGSGDDYATVVPHTNTNSNSSYNNELERYTGVESRLTDDVNNLLNEKTTRLIDWNVDMLLQLLTRIHIRRKASGTEADAWLAKSLDSNGQDKMVLQEVVEIISLPEFDASAAKREHAFQNEVLDSAIKDELRDYVSNIASM
jgi:Adenylate and Guanylate cyclase catalytic domain